MGEGDASLAFMQMDLKIKKYKEGTGKRWLSSFLSLHGNEACLAVLKHEAKLSLLPLR